MIAFEYSNIQMQSFKCYDLLKVFPALCKRFDLDIHYYKDIITFSIEKVQPHKDRKLTKSNIKPEIEIFVKLKP